MKPLKVGKDKIENLNPRKKQVVGKSMRPLLYSDCEMDSSGFCDPAKFMPANFDLCDLLKSTNKVVPGWWNGICWDGHRVANSDTITKWRKIDGDQCE